MKSVFKKIFLLLGGVILIVAIIYFGRKLLEPQKIHYHGGFVVFQNNKKLDFSGSKYMFEEPCVLNAKNEHDTPEDTQLEKAHLHDNVGDLVHVERTGAIWKDLFTNMRFPIDYEKTEGFINGRRVSNYQLQPIAPYDSLVVFIGKNDSSLIKQAVTREYMVKMAKKSTTCGD